MRSVSLAGIPFGIPALGFGCSSLTGTSRKNALRTLEAAYDAGVRHFDVARYYGYGEAEAILGSFARSRRSRVTITSKFGLRPPSRSSPLRVAISLARGFVRMAPGARKFLQKRAGVFVTALPFNAAECSRSLETSLRELRTDYLDFFLLHDYAPTETQMDDLRALLQSFVSSGKIRFFGVGTSFPNILRALALQPQFCDILQFENSVLRPNASNLPAKPANLIITHGALAGSLRSLSSFLKTHPATARLWSSRLSADCADEGVLAALLLSWALTANPNGLVLFSSRSTKRVVRNIECATGSRFLPAQVSSFAALVKQSGLDSMDVAYSGTSDRG